MRQRFDHAPEQLECGCYRYCDSCLESSPSAPDLEFSRHIAESFGEAWFDFARWGTNEFSAVRIEETSRSKQPR